jgi:phospholipid/cholesterol/gamma-HCH transport system substrate-binding protein
MNERAQRIRLGLFVLGAILALGTLVILFAKRPELLRSRDRFYVQFSNAPNIQPGTPVRRSGVKIGEVDKVELDPNGLVKIEMLVDKRYPPRRNETPKIESDFLTKDSKIDLITDAKEKNHDAVNPRDTDPNASPPGTPLVGRGPNDPGEIVGEARGLGQEAKQTLEQIRDSIKEFTRFAPEVEKTMKEYTALSQTIRTAIPELQQTNDSVRKLAETTRANLPSFIETNEKAKFALDQWGKAGEQANVLLMTNQKQITRIIENMNATILLVKQMLGDENQRLITQLLRNSSNMLSDENVKSFNAALKSARQAADSLDRTLQDGPTTVKKLNETLTKADEAIENLRKFTAPFADNAGDFQRNLTYTTGQLGLLIKDVRDFMKGYGSAEGTIQKLLTDPTLYNRTSDAVGSFQRLIPKLEMVIEDLKDFSDKIARHPNQLIFDKGGGLKGSPFAPPAGAQRPFPSNSNPR